MNHIVQQGVNRIHLVSKGQFLVDTVINIITLQYAENF
jgi:hypothetical protein